MGLLSFFHFRRDNKRDRHFVDCELRSGATLAQAIEHAFTTLNEAYKLGIKPGTIIAVAQRLSQLTDITDAGNIVDIYTQYIHKYVLFENRVNKRYLALDDAKLMYAADHLNLVERNGYFLIRTSTEEDFRTKYPDGY